MTETLPPPPVIATSPELRLEDIAKDETICPANPTGKGNAEQQLNAILANVSREFLHFLTAGKNPARKCKAVITPKITIANEGVDQDGRSIVTVVCQIEKKLPAPLPRTNALKIIETERGTPTLAAGHPDDETPLFDGAK